MMGKKTIEAARVYVEETGISDSLTAEDFLVERELTYTRHHRAPVCWEKFASYFEVQLKEVKLIEGYYVMDPVKAVEMVDLEWDFRLPLVKSINVSGHKYGLVYAGVGWVIWRTKEDLPEELVFHINYLGSDQPTFTLNFSKK